MNGVVVITTRLIIFGCLFYEQYRGLSFAQIKKVDRVSCRNSLQCLAFLKKSNTRVFSGKNASLTQRQMGKYILMRLYTCVATISERLVKLDNHKSVFSKF